MAVFTLLTGAGLTSAAIAAQDDFELNSNVYNIENLSLQSLTSLYSERITKLELEIRNESERRTTILHQLDQIISEATALEDKNRSIADNTLPLNENLQQIHSEIEALEKNIEYNESLLDQLQDRLNRQPELSIWHAALGRPDVQIRQKLLATQSYLVHTTRKHQQQLQSKRTLLDQRYQALIEYDQNVKDSIEDMQNKFDTLIGRRKKLEHQLTEISAQIVARQDRVLSLTERSQQMLADPDLMHFANLEKKLKDPVEGRIFKEFSEPKAKGLLKWKGILIDAPLGLPFSAVSDGLVVFADQLQGLGNVAIVDHGQGYMTLYGNSELLLVEKDQFLLAGDPIGIVGESVGADVSALYFEVRHNADALDPQDWLEMHRITQKNTLQRLFSESK